MSKTKTIQCPQCRLKFNYYASKFRPFCSERCQMVDLGHWIGESYQIPSPPSTPEEAIALVTEMERKAEEKNEDETN